MSNFFLELKHFIYSISLPSLLVNSHSWFPFSKLAPLNLHVANLTLPIPPTVSVPGPCPPGLKILGQLCTIYGFGHKYINQYYCKLWIFFLWKSFIVPNWHTTEHSFVPWSTHCDPEEWIFPSFGIIFCRGPFELNQFGPQQQQQYNHITSRGEGRETRTEADRESECT